MPRRIRVLSYTLFGLAGLAAILWPAPSVEAATGWLAYLWAGWLMAGGVLSAAGAATDRWLGEDLGLPLLIAAFGVYGLVIASSGRATSIASSLVLIALALALAARWQDVAWIRREAARAAGHRRD